MPALTAFQAAPFQSANLQYIQWTDLPALTLTEFTTPFLGMPANTLQTLYVLPFPHPPSPPNPPLTRTLARRRAINGTTPFTCAELVAQTGPLPSPAQCSGSSGMSCGLSAAVTVSTLMRFRLISPTQHGQASAAISRHCS
jgi:hypothetical protein